MGALTREYCVYVLSDPRHEEDTVYGDAWCGPDRPFYVGQGRSWRPWMHLVEARRSTCSNLKLNKIRRILKEYECYNVSLVGTGLLREEALKLEKYYIAQIGRADLKKGPLANLTDGGDGGLGMIVSPKRRARASRASTLMHALRSPEKKKEIYAKVGESHRQHRALRSEVETEHWRRSMLEGKQQSIRRIHSSYLKDLVNTMSKILEYKTYAEVRALLPSIPHRTLEKLLKQYSNEGWIKTRQAGANKPKQYLYIL